MRKKCVFCMVLLIFLCFSFLHVNGKSKKTVALGKYDFYHYYTYEEMTKISPPEGELIQKECEMGNNFVTYLAGLAAKLKIGESKITSKNEGIYQLDIAVENTGILPTAMKLAQFLKVVEPVILEVEPDDNVEILFGEKRINLGHIEGNSKSEETTYILRVKDDSKKAVLKAVVKSQRAGKDMKEIVIK